MKRHIVIDEEIKDLSLKFLEKARKESHALRAHLMGGEWGPMKKTAHNLSGNAGTYGFYDLGEIAKRLASALEEKSEGEVTQAIQEMEDLLANMEISFGRSRP